MNASTLDFRIRTVRVGVRARQPLQYRIDLVRRRRAEKKNLRPQAFEVYQNNNS
ncbi:MAG: hypothetical protein P1U68_04030 [Verrucomicrobiales bacterium]|nr:hypothetical protein [Verrucomicrobiales bacterium]